jgi:predicted nucleic acid-binding protein
VRDLLGRPRIRAKNPSLTDTSVVEFIDRVRQVAKRIDTVPASFALARDTDDEPYLNLAIAASADYLVTRDNDMLDLMRDAVFRAQYPTLTILDPVDLLQILNPPTPQP